ncbi:unnamed protein product [Pleuronectes platessa]|uniref:Uncharacterized protein n=1 Tax=Pleuronectes platessa TaxID=8262 RepID=A0A9N7UL46_PLEPL|nr:unnamed protein product [Pleuronectes platessa]
MARDDSGSCVFKQRAHPGSYGVVVQFTTDRHERGDLDVDPNISSPGFEACEKCVELPEPALCQLPVHHGCSPCFIAFQKQEKVPLTGIKRAGLLRHIVAGPEAAASRSGGGDSSPGLTYLTWRYNLYPREKLRSEKIWFSQQPLGINSDNHVCMQEFCLDSPLHRGDNVQALTEDREAGSDELGLAVVVANSRCDTQEVGNLNARDPMAKLSDRLFEDGHTMIGDCRSGSNQEPLSAIYKTHLRPSNQAKYGIAGTISGEPLSFKATGRTN